MNVVLLVAIPDEDLFAEKVFIADLNEASKRCTTIVYISMHVLVCCMMAAAGGVLGGSRREWGVPKIEFGVFQITYRRNLECEAPADAPQALHHLHCQPLL